MINTERLGKPRIPAPKSADPHRNAVEAKARQMIVETEKKPAAGHPADEISPNERAEVPVKDPIRPLSNLPKRSAGRPRSTTNSADQQRILVVIPVTGENHTALLSLIAAQPLAQQAVMQRRLIAKARDLMVADNGRTVWDKRANEAVTCRIRLDPSVATEIYSKLEPLGLRSQSTVLGQAMSAHLNGILDRLPR